MPPCLAVLKCPQLGGESWLQTVTTGEDTKGVSKDCLSDCYEPTLANQERVQNCAFRKRQSFFVVTSLMSTCRRGSC